MSIYVLLQLGLSVVIFLGAGIAAKEWALAPSFAKLALTLVLYSAGNLIMMRLVRDIGMATAFSLSAVVQLVAINAIALAWYSEKLLPIQSIGVALAIVAVTLITLGPSLSR